MWARHRRTGRRYRRSSTGCARRATSLGPCRTCCRPEPSLEAGAAVHLKARLFSAARGLLNARRDGHGDSPGDGLEMGDAAGWVLGAAALEPAAGGLVLGEEQGPLIALVDEIQGEADDLVDAEVVE